MRAPFRRECSCSEHEEAQSSGYPPRVTTQPRLLITWAGEDLETLLTAVGLRVRDGVFELASARIEIDRATPPPGRPRLRIEELATGSGQESGTPGPLDLAALGWATVELDRAARELGGAWESAPDDRLLGASVRQSTQSSPARLLLEPNTEGRLAGALARYGEGPIALYLRVPDPGRVGADLKAQPGSGPLGREWLVPDPNPAGPFLIVVGDQAAPRNANGVPSQA